MWDDWGGLYDHVPPPHVNYDGLGFRVPDRHLALREKRLRVARTIRTRQHFEVCRRRLGLARLSASDTRANSPAEDCFDLGERRERSSPSKPRRARDFSSVSTTTGALPTTSKGCRDRGSSWQALAIIRLPAMAERWLRSLRGDESTRENARPLRTSSRLISEARGYLSTHGR